MVVAIRRPIIRVVVLSCCLMLLARQLPNRLSLNVGLLYLYHALTETSSSSASMQHRDPASQAESWLRRTIIYSPENPAVQEWLGVALAVQGLAEEAGTVWQANGLAIQRLLAWRRAIWQSGRYDEATQLGEWIMQVAPNLDLVPSPLEGQFFVVESFHNLDQWSPCPWCNNVPADHRRFFSDGRILTMSYLPDPQSRGNRFALWSMPNLPIGGHSVLTLRVKYDQDTLLTMEIVVEGRRSRTINYRSGLGKWEVLEVPIGGNVLNEIVVGIGDRENVPVNEEHLLLIDWIALR
jgi:hypothetical protein